MSQDHAWTLGEMAHAIHAERLAEAKHEALVKSVQGHQPPPRVILANVLRALASILDGGAGAPPHQQGHPERQLARAV